MSDYEDQPYPFRTVCVYRYEVESLEENDNQFELNMRQCGDIVTPIYTYQDSFVSFVTFRSAEAVRFALRRRRCVTVDGWLESTFIGSHRRSKWPIIEPLNEIDFISQLDDNSLINIFSLLHFRDLLSVSNVNVRFRNIVTKFMIPRTNCYFLVDAESWKQVESFLQTFGYFVKTLELRSSRYVPCEINFSTTLLLTISNYCSKEYLRSLQLYDISVDDFPIESYRDTKVLLNLVILKILQAPVDERIINEILKLCPSLKRFKVGAAGYSRQLRGQFLEDVPVNIERVTIKGFVQEIYFESFISRCLHLKQLSCYFRETTHITKIVRHQPQLLKLKFCHLGEDVPDFSIDKHVLSIRDLKQLKYFKLLFPSDNDVELVKVLSKMDNLEELVIDTEVSTANEFLPAISKMRRLKTLKIDTYPSARDASTEWRRFLSSLSVSHPHLEHLDIHVCDVYLLYYLPVISNHSRLKTLAFCSWIFEADFMDMQSYRKTVEARKKDSKLMGCCAERKGSLIEDLLEFE